MKLAQVLPLYKSDDPMYSGHYRTVSVLPVLSKVLERIMYQRMLDFLTKLIILYKYQFGFHENHENHSTYMALILLMDKLTTALDKGNCVIGVFLDFSKPFATIDHDLLLKKLEMYGIRGVALD